MKLGKRKSPIIPVGEFERESKREQEEFQQEQEREFYEDPMIPWWIKAAYALSPVPLYKADRTPKWCKLCGRKHSKREACEALHLTEDLTHPGIKAITDGQPKAVPHTKVGFYTTRPKEAPAT